MATKFKDLRVLYYHRPSLTLVTTSDVTISPSAVKYAGNQGIRLGHAVSYYRVENNIMFIIFVPHQVSEVIDKIKD